MAEHNVHEEDQYKLMGALEIHFYNGEVYKEYNDGRTVMEYPNGRIEEVKLTVQERYILLHGLNEDEMSEQ